MKIEKQEIIYNLNYIVCVPNYDKDLVDSLSYNFKNIYFLDGSWNDIENFINFVKRSNIKNIIFTDFLIEYVNIINLIDPSIEIKFLFTKSMAHLSNDYTNLIFSSIIDLYNKNFFKHLGVLDKNLYLALLKSDIKVDFISLDIQAPKDIVPSENSNNIGILNDDFNPSHSFYNQLSAIKLNKNNFIANVFNPLKETKEFLDIFDIKHVITKNKKEFYEKQNINLYINFTNSNNLVFLKSMDAGIPCILGNTSILDENDKLKDYLTVNSDDDINEISEKINYVIENKEKIINEYKTFRSEYSNKSLESIRKFIGYEYKENVENSNNEDILLTVVVPVYNTEKYIEECINSLYKARIKKMEVLVINDGSTDKSEEVIYKCMKKHPNFIRYIKQENHGLGNVRNVGLKNAKGKYIASVDSDDSISKEFFKESLPYLEKDIDIIMCNWLSIYSKKEKYETAALDYIFQNLNQYKGLLYTTIMPSTCNKIIKKSLLIDTGYTYAEGLKYEDLSLNPIVLLKAKSIKYINKPYYEYKIRENSIMRTSAGYNMIDVIKMLDSRINSINVNEINVDLNEFKYYTYFWRVEEFIFNQLYTLEESERKKYIKYITDEIYDILVELYNNKCYIERKKAFNKDIQNYLNSRNKALFDKKLDSFIEEFLEKDTYKKLTPPMIFYGRD